jgi:winged helix DNA-binding protein
LRDFRREDLAREIENRKVVKATMMRATLHICAAEDYLRFRTALNPVLIMASSEIAKRRGGDFDTDKVLKAARKFIGEKPRTFAEISDMLTDLMPDHDVGAMRYSVRTHIPLVQVPINTGWSYSNKPEFTLAESWIGRPISPEDNLREMLFRYLAAFGPASVTDAQTWSGMKLKETFEKLRPELRTCRGEGRTELFDLPDTQLPSEDVPAPVRFLPEYDNLLLSQTKTAATLLIEQFDKLTKRDRAALAEEGERLARFVEPKAKSFEVKFTTS